MFFEINWINEVEVFVGRYGICEVVFVVIFVCWCNEVLGVCVIIFLEEEFLIRIRVDCGRIISVGV